MDTEEKRFTINVKLEFEGTLDDASNFVNRYIGKLATIIDYTIADTEVKHGMA